MNAMNGMAVNMGNSIPGPGLATPAPVVRVVQEDGLPDPENLAGEWNQMPDLAPPLIGGVLRQGHKMLVAGPSKAGKSIALIELCIAIAEGSSWLGFKCAQGRVLYVNLELDKASCLHRFKDVYEALQLTPAHLDNIDIWNLRGRSLAMDKLAPKLIRRAVRHNYIAVIIDPIYKVITGDENSADQMAHFCNQFDKVCTELGCAVIYCHHHSKGVQGNKRSMDRASGSGVFARDPDAILDLIELDTENCVQMSGAEAFPEGEKAAFDPKQDHLPIGLPEPGALQQEAAPVTAWRVEGTLREFPKFKPVNLWFRYPVHFLDEAQALELAGVLDGQPPWQKGGAVTRRKKQAKVKQLTEAFAALEKGGTAGLEEVAELMQVSTRTVRTYVKEGTDFVIRGSKIVKKV
jgi:RecA-family ATPase